MLLRPTAATDTAGATVRTAEFVVGADPAADGELTSPQLPGSAVREGDLTQR